MGYSNLWLSVTGMGLDLILILFYLQRRRNNVYQEQAYGSMLTSVFTVNLIAVIYSLLLILFGEHVMIDRAVAWIETIFITLVPASFLNYLNSVFYYDRAQKRATRILLTLTGASLLMVLLLGPVVICTRRTIMLRPRMGTPLLMIPACLFLAVGLVQGLLLHRSVTKRHLRTLRVIFVICLLSLIFFYIYRTASVYGFMTSMVPLLCEFTLEGKGMLTDQETGLRSHNAYRTSVVARLEQNIAFRLILIHCRNLTSLVSELDQESGHKVMEKVTQILRNTTDLPSFRLNDDTFAILQEDRDEALTQEILISLRSRFSDTIKVHDRILHLGGDICVVDLPADVKTMEDLEIVAELLEEGNDQVGVRVRAFASLNLEGEKVLREQIADLSRGLQENRLEVWYQPILNTKTGKFESAEALVRMKDDRGEYVRPDNFIPAAEKCGLITRVGQAVLTEVCRFLATDERKALGVKYIEANLSVEEAIQEGISAKIRAIMEQFGTEASSLNIEVTETANDTASELMLTNMRKIHEEEGIELSLDDFGTGYSNLSRLLAMPVDLIKFDRTMLVKAFETEEGRVVFERTVDLIHELGRKIVSEGVETEEQAAFVKSLGIEYIQGFYYAKPMPKERYLEFLRKHQA